MATIWYKKQMFGQWRRMINGSDPKHITDERMQKEVEMLINDGWSVKPHGVHFLRAIEVTKI